MADIIIRGQTHEAKIVETYEQDGFDYQCSRGAWCNLSKIDPRDNMRDVIEDAVLHVDAHDAAVNDGVPDRA